MANFDQALLCVLKHEGGYVNDPDDAGGETYKGIARKMNGSWEGWTTIDSLKKQPGFPASLDNNQDLQLKVKAFYEISYWDKVKGDAIVNQDMATSIFDFAVNAGVSTSAKLAQTVVNATPDGVIGTQTLAKLNAFDPTLFRASFTVAKISRYVSIVKSNPNNKKFFYGWVCRAIDES